MEEFEHLNDPRFETIKQAYDAGPSIRPEVKAKLTNTLIPHHEIFLEHFVPSLQGTAAKIDKFHSSTRSKYHTTYVTRNIKFHDSNVGQDPDHVVKSCLLLMIHTANQPFKSMEDYWRSRDLCNASRNQGLLQYPDFGKFVDFHVFQLFKEAFPRIWGHEDYWYLPFGYEIWDMFQPFVEEWNEKSKSLFDDPTDGDGGELVSLHSFDTTRRRLGSL